LHEFEGDAKKLSLQLPRRRTEIWRRGASRPWPRGLHHWPVWRDGFTTQLWTDHD